MRKLGLFSLLLAFYILSVISCDEEKEKIKPEASFIISNQEPRIYDSIQFINQSENAESYSWNFGDGSVSTITDPKHVYTNTGLYNIELISSNSVGSDTLNQSIQIDGLVLTEETINGKWEIVGSAANQYRSIEFFKSGKFLIIPNESNGIYYSSMRDYTILNSNSIESELYGSLKDFTITHDSIEFKMSLLSNPSDALLIKAIKAECVSNSLKTEMLSGFWKAITYHGATVEDLNMEIELLFSEYGTYDYYSMDWENGISGFGRFNWRWKDSNEEILCYSTSEDVECDGNNEVEIEVSSTTLITVQNGYETVLVPISK